MIDFGDDVIIIFDESGGICLSPCFEVVCMMGG